MSTVFETETKTTTIGDNTFHVRPLGVGMASSILVRLTKAMGPVLGAWLGGQGGVGTSPQVNLRKLLDSDLASIAKALDTFCTQLKEEDLTFLRRELGKATMVEDSEGKTVPLSTEKQEILFRGGHLVEMFRWLGFALDVQYSDFFAVLASVSGPPDGEVEKDTQGSSSLPT